jgi:hypothetical protein
MRQRLCCASAASEICRVFRTGRWLISRGRGSHLNASPLLGHYNAKSTFLRAGVDFSRAYGTKSALVPEGRIAGRASGSTFGASPAG